MAFGKRDPVSQLLITVHDLAAGFDRRQQIDAILLDFSKGFDKVPYQRLAAKLHHYGIRDQTLSWIKSFLADRSQQVVLDVKSSSRCSVLFCSWFTSMICPIESPRQYDCSPTTVCCKEWSKTIKIQFLQTNLDQLQEWERDWQMLFNPDKCEHIRITKKRKIIQTTYIIHGQQLKETAQAKYLGVTIDNKLSWNSHVDLVTKRANQTTAFLHRNLSTCSRDVKSKYCKSLVRPQLDYASTT